MNEIVTYLQHGARMLAIVLVVYAVFFLLFGWLVRKITLEPEVRVLIYIASSCFITAFYFISSESPVQEAISGMLVLYIIYLPIYIIKKAIQSTSANKEKKQEKLEDEANSKEWGTVKKYVVEAQQSMAKLTEELGDEGIALGEQKLKELFFILGKDGMTSTAINIIIADVKKDLATTKEKQK